MEGGTGQTAGNGGGTSTNDADDDAHPAQAGCATGGFNYNHFGPHPPKCKFFLHCDVIPIFPFSNCFISFSSKYVFIPPFYQILILIPPWPPAFIVCNLCTTFKLPN